jgi:hypothetical protein
MKIQPLSTAHCYNLSKDLFAIAASTILSATNWICFNENIGENRGALHPSGYRFYAWVPPSSSIFPIHCCSEIYLFFRFVAHEKCLLGFHFKT